MTPTAPIILTPAEPSVRELLIRGYREIADTCRLLGLADIAVKAEERAAALEWGGPVDWSVPCVPRTEPAP